MPLNIPAGYVNWIVTIRNIDGGAAQRNSIGIGTDFSGTIAQADVNRIANLFRDNLKPLWDNRWEVGPVHALAGFGLLDPQVYDDTTVEAGTASATDYAPPQIAQVVSKQTGIARKSQRGRFYLPGVPSGFIGEDGGINPTRVTAVQTAVNALYTALSADAAITVPVLLHETSSPTPDPTAITQFLARPISGTVRPRNRR